MLHTERHQPRYWIILAVAIGFFAIGWMSKVMLESAKSPRSVALSPLSVSYVTEINEQTGSRSRVAKYDHTEISISKSEILKGIESRRVQLDQLVKSTPYVPDAAASRVTFAEETDAYARYDVLLPTESGIRPTNGQLFVPKSNESQAPAILFFHGHYDDNSIFTDPDSDGGNTNFHAKEHAKAGFITFVIENRATSNIVRYTNYELLQGRSYMALAVRDALVALEFLRSRPEVDTQRIGVAGVSLGGAPAMYVAAIDTKIRTAVISGFLNIYQGLLVRHIHDLYWYGIMEVVGEMPQIASLIAPRPLLVQHGLDDTQFYTQGTIRHNADQAYAYLSNIYGILGASKNVQHVIFEGGHEYHNGSSIAFFKKYL